MDALMIVLRLTHIILGVLWAGWVFALPLFVEPASRIAGPAAGPFMQALTGKTKLVMTMTIAPLFVIASGTWMLWKVSNGLDSYWMTSHYGMSLFTGSVIGILAYVYAMSLLRPIAVKMAALGAAIQASGSPPTTEHQEQLAGLRAGMRVHSRIVAVALLICVAIMATSRYMV